MFDYNGLGKELKMEPLPDYGDLMTLGDWLDCVESGGFIDYDGLGRYATDKEMSNIYVVPSDVEKGKVDKSWSHVVWFNR
jgi:hypothetical protein